MTLHAENPLVPGLELNVEKNFHDPKLQLKIPLGSDRELNIEKNLHNPKIEVKNKEDHDIEDYPTTSMPSELNNEPNYQQNSGESNFPSTTPLSDKQNLNTPNDGNVSTQVHPADVDERFFSRVNSTSQSGSKINGTDKNFIDWIQGLNPFTTTTVASEVKPENCPPCRKYYYN